MFRIRDEGLESRLALAAAAFAAAAVPASLLAFAATHGWAPLHDIDSGVADELNEWATVRPNVVSFFQGVSNVIDPWNLRAAAVVVTVGLAVRKQTRLAMWVGTTVVAAGLMGLGLKLVVGRARPVLPDPVDAAGGYSFPSGHALNSFAIFGVFVLLFLPTVARRWRPLLWAAAITAVALVGLARISLGVHYVSDVVAAWIIGAGLIAVTTTVFETWRRDHGERVPAHVLDEGVDPEGARAALGETPTHV